MTFRIKKIYDAACASTLFLLSIAFWLVSEISSVERVSGWLFTSAISEHSPRPPTSVGDYVLEPRRKHVGGRSQLSESLTVLDDADSLVVVHAQNSLSSSPVTQPGQALHFLAPRYNEHIVAYFTLYPAPRPNRPPAGVPILRKSPLVAAEAVGREVSAAGLSRENSSTFEHLVYEVLNSVTAASGTGAGHNPPAHAAIRSAIGRSMFFGKNYRILRIDREQESLANYIVRVGSRVASPLFAAAAMLYVAAVLRRLIIADRRARRFRQGLCPRCSYPRVADGRCPECGWLPPDTDQA